MFPYKNFEITYRDNGFDYQSSDGCVQGRCDTVGKCIDQIEQLERPEQGNVASLIAITLIAVILIYLTLWY